MDKNRSKRDPATEGDAPKDVSSPEPTVAENDEQAQELERLGEENRFLVEGLSRVRAEFDNYRRRTLEEHERQGRRVKIDVIRSVLPLVDDLELALKAEEESPGQLHEGIRLIVEKFQKVLSSFSVEPIEAVGQPFDPNFHEAMLQIETHDLPEGHVVDEMERGYRLGDDLIRPSRVQVAKAPSKGRDSGGDGSESGSG